MLGPFLLDGRAARDGAPCPSDEAIAASYGTASLGRARQLLNHIESPRPDRQPHRPVGQA